jgi:murein DD-endopeptidase MepM/ murein hydrolase activator NlpD
VPPAERRLLGALLFCASLAAAGSTDEARFDGRFVQGGLVVGQVAPGSRVQLDGREIRVSPRGDFLLGFDRDAAETGELIVTTPAGGRVRRELAIETRVYDIQRIDGLPPRQVTPSAADLKRIERENAMIREARSRDDPRTDFLGGFRWPALGRISGVYGSQRILNGEPRRPHYGVDVAAPVGTPVRAPAAGNVTLVHRDMFFSGGTLILDHGHGLSSSFLHLSKIHVRQGQRVGAGELIAEIGATGRVSGPHLHWNMNLGAARLDPQLLAGEMPGNSAQGDR